MSGVVGVYGIPQASVVAFLCLYGQQHRGDKRASIVSCQDGETYLRSADGWVSHSFNSEQCLASMPGDIALGFNGRERRDIAMVDFQSPCAGSDFFAMAHEGTFLNASALHAEFIHPGVSFGTQGEGETLLRLAAYSDAVTIRGCLEKIFRRCVGAYSAVIVAGDQLVAVRDPGGVWPLCFGGKDGGYIVASESCALDVVDATYLGEVLPGEIIVFSRDGVRSSFFSERSVREARCALEFSYFGRPDSLVRENNLYSIRREFGRQIARESPVAADVVVPMPDAEVPVALGFSEVSGVPFDILLLRNHYTNSAELFKPVSLIKDFDFRRKTSGAGKTLGGKRVVVCDDSMLRGENGAKLVRLLRDRDAAEVHLRVCFPPISYPCPCGASTPAREELIAASCSVEEIRQRIGADSLAFLSIEGMERVLRDHGDGYCFACVTGEYPVSFSLPHTVGKTL